MLANELKLTSWDERRDLIIPGDYNSTIAFCVRHFIALSKEAISDHGCFFVALSGGSTPKALFERITSHAFSAEIDWKKIIFFWSDERAVPPDDPESNYHMAMEAGLSKMGIPPAHIHRMPAEKAIEENALLYEKTIQETLKGRPFDLIMLGMGEDGHVASLFPGTEGLYVKGRLVVANYIPQKKCWRMTLTFECINHARHIVLYVLGAAKKEMLAQVLHSKSMLYPAERVGTNKNKALWIVDEAAGALLETT